MLDRECTQCHQSRFAGDFRDPDLAYAALMDPDRRVGRLCNANETAILRVVVPGEPEQSGLWQLVGVGYNGCRQKYGMPKFDPRGLLIDFAPEDAQQIRDWILDGAILDAADGN